MNILMISATYPPSANGVAISTDRTVTALRTLGHNVAVLAPGTGQREVPSRLAFPTIRIPFLGLKDYPVSIPVLSSGQMRELRKATWDIVHVHHPFIHGEFAIHLGKKLSAPVVFTYHTQYDQVLDSYEWIPHSLRRFAYDRFVLRLLRRFDGIIATTKWLRIELRDLVADNNSVYYASTAGLLQSFRTEQGLAEAKSTIGQGLRGPIFLAVSRLSVEKNADLFIKSFLSWAEHNEEGNLVCVGDGPYRNHLQKLVASHPEGKRVTFTGRIPNAELPAWYSIATVFLYTSTKDTIGINIIEAMSAGLPVVAPRHPTTQEVITDGYNGVLVGPAPEAMSTGMDKALLLRDRLSMGAYETAKEFDIQHLTFRLVEVYSAVIATYRGKTRP